VAQHPYQPASTDPVERRGDSNRNLAVAVYLLLGLSFFVGGITALAAVIINYLKMDDVRGTWIEPHFHWQIQTFWVSLLWVAAGVALLMVLIGWLVLLVGSIWTIYRVVRGALALNDGRAP